MTPSSGFARLLWRCGSGALVGKAALHDLLRAWLPRLAPDGEAYLVVQRNLGSDSLQRWVEAELSMPCTRHTSSRGFRVLRVGTAT